MKVKRVLLCVMALMLVLCTLPSSAFAADSSSNIDAWAWCADFDSIVIADADGNAEMEINVEEGLTNVKYQWKTGGAEISGATDPVYTATGITAPKEFDCTVSADGKKDITLRIKAVPDSGLYAYVKGTESDDYEDEVKLGETLTLSVDAGTADGSAVSYTWYGVQIEDGGYSIDATCPPISGANGNSYTTEPITTAYAYICEVQDQYGAYSSVSFRIKVDNGLEAHPEGVDDYGTEITVSNGASATLKVVATAENGKISYQWYDGNGAPVKGATGASYTTPAVTEQTNYFCKVSDEYDNHVQITFVLSVDNSFAAYVKGTEETRAFINATKGSSAKMEVEASAKTGNLTYEWKVYDEESYEYSDVPGAKGSSCTVKVTGSSQYICTVTDAFGNREDIYFHIDIQEDVVIVDQARDENGSPVSVTSKSESESGYKPSVVLTKAQAAQIINNIVWREQTSSTSDNVETPDTVDKSALKNTGSYQLNIIWQDDLSVPAGTKFPVSVWFSVANVTAGQDIYVYHHNGSEWELVGTGAGTGVVATFDSLSPVAVVTRDPSAAAPVSTDAAAAPQTGDSSIAIYGILAGVALVAIIVIIVIMVIRRRR